jgi:hypothetical protein
MLLKNYLVSVALLLTPFPHSYYSARAPAPPYLLVPVLILRDVALLMQGSQRAGLHTLGKLYVEGKDIYHSRKRYDRGGKEVRRQAQFVRES